MQNKKIADRRIFQRFPISSSLRLLDKYTNKWSLVQAQDISARGVGILTQEELKSRTPLELWLTIPNTAEQYYTRGEVVWSKMLQANKYKAGIELEKVDLMGISQIINNS